ncbi:MFS transporter [Pectinatus sottacetonis]|uniref:MFS transporter n=1 Tax=Pectinatus sottacetonis TaxID=1002795 RepID=UPI0018C5D8B1
MPSAHFIKKGDKQYWPTIAALFFGSFVTFALLYCFQPLIPVFSSEYKISPSIASLSISMATGSLAIAMLLTPSLSDHFGRKLIMCSSILGSTILIGIIAFIDNFYVILPIRIVEGIFLAGYPAIAMTYIQEEFDPGITGIVMGIFISGNSVGGLLGRLLVSTLTDLFSWHVAIGTLSILSFFISIWFYKNLPVSQNFQPCKLSLYDVAQRFTINLKVGKLVVIYMIGFLIMGSFVALYNYAEYPLLAPPYSLSQTLVGFIFIIYLVGTFSSTFMSRLASLHGELKVLDMGLMCMLLGIIITILLPLWLKILGIALFTFGFFGSHSIASSMVVKYSPVGKAQSSALYLLFYYAGSSFIGTWGGNFLIWKGWSGIVILLSGSICLALVLSNTLLVKNYHSSVRKLHV